MATVAGDDGTGLIKTLTRREASLQFPVIPILPHPVLELGLRGVGEDDDQDVE